MHDIDETLDEFEFEQELEAENEFEFENEYGDDEYDDEFEYELEAEVGVETLPATTEEELAEELYAVESEEDMDEFIGSLARAAVPLLRRGASMAGREAVRFYNSRTGRNLRRRLAGAIRKGVPQAARQVGGYAGRRAGGYVGGRVGGRVGRQLGRRAGGSLGRRAGSYVGNRLANWGAGLLGYEIENVSPEMEFEVAKKLVRFGVDAAKKAAIANKKRLPNATSTAIRSAAKKHLRSAGSGRGGKWVRKGNNILIMGA